MTCPRCGASESLDVTSLQLGRFEGVYKVRILCAAGHTRYHEVQGPEPERAIACERCGQPMTGARLVCDPCRGAAVERERARREARRVARDARTRALRSRRCRRCQTPLMTTRKLATLCDPCRSAILTEAQHRRWALKRASVSAGSA